MEVSSLHCQESPLLSDTVSQTEKYDSDIQQTCQKSDKFNNLGCHSIHLVMKEPHDIEGTGTGIGGRKNSTGSHIPMPDLKSKLPKALAQDKILPGSPSRRVKPTTPGAMLSSTLRKMSKLATSKDRTSAQQREHGVSNTDKDLSRGLKTNQARLMRKTSREVDLPIARGPPTNSLRRAKNKDSAGATSSAMVSSLRDELPRTTSGTSERRRINRSHSVNAKRTRDRNLNVKKSRSVQTQLTLDIIADSDGLLADESPATNVEFNLYMPALLDSGGVDDMVEVVSLENLEPMDVRKSRQLTLDNMKLQREVERLKNQLAEASKEKDMLRKDKRSLGSKLEDIQARLSKEEKLRTKLEHQMDRRDEKMKEIEKSMENVEKEFESRDESIRVLEERVQEYKDVISKLEDNFAIGQAKVSDLQGQLDCAVNEHKASLQQLNAFKNEAMELQEFLHAEKLTLAETLKESEAEVLELKDHVLKLEEEKAATEERGSHLVRLCEQRNQENLALQAQLIKIQEQAKEMLLAQGSEISRATIYATELHSKLEQLLLNGGQSFLSAPTSLAPLEEASNGMKPNGAETKLVSSLSLDMSLLSDNCVCIVPDDKLLLPTQKHSVVRSSSRDALTTVLPGDQARPSRSLHNLFEAIAHRQKLENHKDNVATQNGPPPPSLVDRIYDIQSIVDKLLKEKRVQ